MLKITFQHEARFESLAEVLRLFFTGVKPPVSGQKPPYSLEFTLPEQEGKLELIQRVLDQGGEVTCETSLEAEDKEFSPELMQQLSRTVEPKMVRRELKRQLYLALAELTGQKKAWGSLTGVRPTMVAAELVRELGPDQARLSLDREYGLRQEKIDLALAVSGEEERILASLDPDEDMVYVGIPFCHSRCSYCSFIAQDAKRYQAYLGDYVEAIVKDFKYLYRRRSRPVSALYFGGGTPSSLEAEDLDRLLAASFAYLPLKPGAEVTFEAGRPDSLSEEKLRILRSYPIDRICLNPQTLHDRTLRAIGRRHTVAEFRQAAEWIKDLDFKSVNMDLICGLPGESKQDFLASVRGVLELEPENITLHSLALKRAARLRHEVEAVAGTPAYIKAGKLEESLYWAMEEAQAELVKAGYRPYYLYRQKNLTAGLENTGFALPGTESIYNVGMMSDRISILGFGAGASTKAVFGRRLERYVNVKDIGLYIERWQDQSQKKVELFALQEAEIR